MIQVIENVENYCNDCPFFICETEHIKNDPGTVHMVYVQCEHRESCKNLMQYLERKIKGDDKNDQGR